MAFIDWKPEFSVGIVRLDEDHRHLISLLNQLRSAMADDQGRFALRSILEGLIWYTRSHFKAEEELMQRYDYPKLVSHTAEHEYLTNRVVRFAERFKSGEAIPFEVAAALEDEWLTKHILKCDAAYAEFFRSHGIADVVVERKSVIGPIAAEERARNREHDWLRHRRAAAPHC